MGSVLGLNEHRGNLSIYLYKLNGNELFIPTTITNAMNRSNQMHYEPTPYDQVYLIYNLRINIHCKRHNWINLESSIKSQYYETQGSKALTT